MGEALRFLIVDDDRSVCFALDRALRDQGHTAVFAFSADECWRLMKAEAYDAVFLDLIMPDMDGIDMLQRIKQTFPSIEVITMSGAGSMRTALGTLQMNAFDYLPKPIQPQALTSVVERLKKQHPLPPPPTANIGNNYARELVGKSPSIQRVIEMIKKVGPSSVNVLIRGETGTGKEVVAHAVHNASPRKNGPFIAVNCSALPDTLLESELFGHEKGAFTDATGLKKGLLEVANAGTLFLDEIGEISQSLQAKLLRVVETKRFRRLGSTQELSSDVRIVSATNRDLEKSVKEGSFREDLFYRLGVIAITLPPLRERPEDIPLLVDNFTASLAAGRPRKKLTETALGVFARYAWPGNVRELHNVLERAHVLSESDSIDVAHLPEHLRQTPAVAKEGAEQPLSLEEIERHYIEKVYQEQNGRLNTTAKILGISEKTLRTKLRSFKDAS